jgi:hypothetical protein
MFIDASRFITENDVNIACCADIGCEQLKICLASGNGAIAGRLVESYHSIDLAIEEVGVVARRLWNHLCGDDGFQHIVAIGFCGSGVGNLVCLTLCSHEEETGVCRCRLYAGKRCISSLIGGGNICLQSSVSEVKWLLATKGLPIVSHDDGDVLLIGRDAVAVFLRIVRRVLC